MCISPGDALDYVPRKVDDDCLRELRWLYDRRDLAEARAVGPVRRLTNLDFTVGGPRRWNSRPAAEGATIGRTYPAS
jgi:hypothetical protein